MEKTYRSAVLWRLIILAFWLINGCAVAQNRNSLWKSLSQCNPSNKTEICEQAMSLDYSKFDSIIPKAQSILNHTEISNCRFNHALLHHIIGRAELRRTNLPEAYIHLNDALTIYSQLGDSLNMIRTLGSIATIYVEWQQYGEGVAKLKRALEISERNKLNYYTSRLLNNLGLAAHRQKDYQTALQYLHAALDFKLKDEDQAGLANTYGNIGEVYTDMGDLNNAWLFLSKGLNIRQLVGDVAGIAESHYSLGKYHLANNDAPKAIVSLEKGYQLSLQSNDIYKQINCLSLMGDAAAMMQDTFKANTFWGKAIALCNDLRLTNLEISINTKLTNLLAGKHDFQKTSELLQRRASLQDSMLKTFQEYQATNAFTHQTVLENPKSDRSHFLRLIFIILAIGIGLLVLTLWMAYAQRKARLTLLSQMKTLEEEKNQLTLSLQDFNQRLENEVSLRTSVLKSEMEERKRMDIELKKSLKQAEDANFLKNAFLANMSHEIRTPLNGIIGFSSLLETELSLLENKELYDYASGILESGERLLHLLNNLIDISRIEANDMEVALTACQVPDILMKVSELYKFKANESGLKLNVVPTEVPEILADEKNLMRVLSDIIDNALKYTEKGFINVSCGETQDAVVIRVKDTGIGIDQTYLPHLFEAFRQESLGYGRAYQGAGLGLPLAKRLIELMGGAIQVVSAKGEGTTVTLSFNKLEASHLPASIPTIKDSGADSQIIITSRAEIQRHEKRIFIVEDDRMNRLVLSKMLQQVAQLELAVDGDETMTKIADSYSKDLLFDLMLFDINLPMPWDGTRLMQEIRQKYPKYRAIPFVAQTAYAMSGDREKLLEAGFDDYISKPISKSQLLKTVEKYLIQKVKP